MFFTSQISSEQQNGLMDERLHLEKVYQSASLKAWARAHWNQWESLAYVHIFHILLRGSKSWLLKKNGMTFFTFIACNFFPNTEEEKGCFGRRLCHGTYV